MVKRFKKLLIIGSGTLVLLFVAGWIIVRLYHDDIRKMAEQVIDKQIDALVTFDDVSVSILQDFPNVTVTLHDLVVTGEEDFSNDTLATVDELDFEILASSLLPGAQTAVKSIHLNRPHLFLKVLKGGATNYDIFKSDSVSTSNDSTSRSNVDVRLDQVEIGNAIIEYRDQPLDMYVLMTDVDHVGKGDLNSDLFDLRTITTIGEFSLDRGKVRVLTRKEVAVDLVLQMNLKERSITFRENRIRMNHFSFELQGSLERAENAFNLDVSFSSPETDFKNIISLVPGIFMDDFKKITTRGRLGFKGFVIGRYDPASGQLPSLMTNVKVEDAMFKIDTLPDPIENIQMEMVISNLHGNIDSTVVDIKNFQFDLRKHLVRGRFKLQGYNQFRIDTDIIANLDLSELERMYPIDSVELKGIVDLELKAKGGIGFSGERLVRLPSFHLDLRLKDGKLKYNHLPAAIENIQFHLLANNANGQLESSEFDFRNVHLDLDKNTVHGFLKVSGYSNLKVNSDMKMEIDLADVERLFPMDGVIMKGNLSMDMKANGIYNAELRKFPTVDARLELANGYLKTSGYPKALENVHLSGEAVNTTGTFADTRIAINRLTYNLDDEIFEVRGTVSDLDHYDYDLKVKGLVDLAKLSKIYPMEGVEVSGVIISDFETRGRLSDVEAGLYEKTRSDGRIEVKNLSVKIPSVKNTLFIHDATYTFTPSKIVLERCNGRFGRSTFTLTGDLFNYMAFATRSNDKVTGDLDLKCDTLDVNEWLAVEKSNVLSQGTADNKIRVWQVPANVEAVFDSEIDHVLYEDMRISKLDGEIRIKDGKLSLHETGFNSLNAEFNLSGTYDTRDIKHPAFDMNLDIKELDISKAYREMKLVRELMPAAGNAEGTFSIGYKLKGELSEELFPKLETLSGSGEIRIANAKINGMKIFEQLSKASKKQEVNDPHLRDFVMRSEIRDNKIIVKPFSMRVSGIDADVQGVSEISGAIRYLVKIQLMGIKVPFHVTGTYSDPKVQIGKGHVLVPSDSLPN